MEFVEFQKLLSSVGEPVVLLEGSRDVKEGDGEKLAGFAARLASVFPTAVFRSGDADGSDAIFAEGVDRIDAGRLQIVLPNDRKVNVRNGGTRVSLEQLPRSEKSRLIELTKHATPANRSLIELYEKGMAGRTLYRAQYLIRDTLKVTGSEKFKMRPASVGCFYVNSTKASGGGTGHTIRVCEQLNVPTVTQEDWFRWFDVA